MTIKHLKSPTLRPSDHPQTNEMPMAILSSLAHCDLMFPDVHLPPDDGLEHLPGHDVQLNQSHPKASQA